MISQLKTALLLSTWYISSRHNAQAVTVGDQVCITGYIMDNFCIEFKDKGEGGFLLDNQSVLTLQHPEEHSFHCLLDVSVCYQSGFQVLGEKNPDTDRHCLGFRLDDTDAVLAAGRAAGQSGYCSSCAGDSDAHPEYGYRATVKGTVKEMGDGSDGVTGSPILTNIELLDESVGCEGNPTVPPLCAMERVVTTTQFPTLMPSVEPTAAELQSVGPTQSCPSTLDESTELDSSATLHYAMVPSNPPGSGNGLLCARLEVENHVGWVGFGISEDTKMAGSEAIIGVPGEDVLKYDLGFYQVAGPMSEDKQTLRDTSIDEIDGKTIMEFTKLLVEDGEIPFLEDDENIFLHARGGSSLGYHTSRLVFMMEFTSPTDQPTAKPITNSPTAKPVTNSPSKQPTEKPVTNSPSMNPTAKTATDSPTTGPSTAVITTAPTEPSTAAVPDPTTIPTTTLPTFSPTAVPSIAPSKRATESPTPALTATPSKNTATVNSSMVPTSSPAASSSASAPTASPSDTTEKPFEFGLTSKPTQSSAGTKSSKVGIVLSLMAVILCSS
ncbi:hypothetical protein ACHAXR_002878 [Thalassiosira sp. AJA248-18]